MVSRNKYRFLRLLNLNSNSPRWIAANQRNRIESRQLATVSAARQLYFSRLKVACGALFQVSVNWTYSSSLSKSKKSGAISYKYTGCLTTPMPRSTINSAIASPSRRRIVIAPFL
jgi:hypothetical protein